MKDRMYIITHSHQNSFSILVCSFVACWLVAAGSVRAGDLIQLKPPPERSWAAGYVTNSAEPGTNDSSAQKPTIVTQTFNPVENPELLEALLKKSTNAVEKAQLEETLGRLYSYRTGLVDYPKALVHLTAALQNELPERNYLELLLLRGNCQE